MPIHFERELEKLKKRILSLGAEVEESVRLATKSLQTRDADLAKKVIERDPHIDHLEVDLEEECLKILALYQPVAIDLRFIIAVLKINSDLERIGDLAVNIAERASFLATQKPREVPFDFLTMSEKAQAMLRKSLDALANINPDLAYQVCASDDEVDTMNREMYQLVEDAIRKHPAQLEYLIHMLSASRHLERIADLATDISEDVIYMAKGEIIRHRTEDFKPQAPEG
jgi:phosphate transport system protein